MNRAGQYQGSQAFSHIVPVGNETVNPNTGSLNYRIPLLQLRGIRPSVELNLGLVYGCGTAGTFGLPPCWSLDLPYIMEGKSLTANGRTYAIDLEWSDESGYASGLRYMNNHGIKFKKIDPPQDLPSRLPGQYTFQLNMVDGSSTYFDFFGKPLEYRDVFDNYIYYAYVDGASGGVERGGALLDYIQDSWGQKIQFGCNTYEWDITLPDGASISLSLSDDGVESVTDPAQLITTFEYADFDGSTKVLSIISHPTGLISQYDFVALAYLDQNGNSKNVPAVQGHYHFDAEYRGCSHTEYNFGAFSGGSTYTGSAIGLPMGGGTDQLVDGNGEASSYLYDVIKTCYDEKENQISRICTWYNNYHLAVSEIRYILSSEGDFVEATKTDYTYDIPVEKQARTTAYIYPVSTVVSQNTDFDGEPDYRPLTRSIAAYNEYGQQLFSRQDLYTPNAGYVQQTTTTNEYTTGANSIQLLTKSIHRDAVAQSEDQTESFLSPDRKNIASTTLYFYDGDGSQRQPWTKRSFAHDSSGRITSETIAWADGANVPAGSVASSTNTVSYSFSNGILTQIGYDADGNGTSVQYDVRRYTGPMMKKTLPLGQVEAFEYDNIGRPIKYIDALGHETTTNYATGPNGGSQKVTSPMGYTKLSNIDALGREITVYDNGDPTKPFMTEPSRLLSRKTYDFLSRVCEATNNLGLVTKSTYDALSRPLTVTDPKQNVLRYQYDDVNLQVTYTINGETKCITQLNGRFDQLSLTTYPDSDDTSTDYYAVEDTTYDGNRRTISKTLSQKRKGGGSATTAIVNTTKCGPDSVVLSNTVTGYYNNGQDTVKRDFIVDLFGNTYTWTKKTSYNDGRNIPYNGPVRIYDHHGRLVLTRNQLNQEERSTYNANGWLSKVERYDKSEVVYTCDAVGQFIKEEYPESTSEFTFNGDGRLHKINDTDTIQYDTALDGTLTKVTYGDGKSQSFGLDEHSRTIKETDALGVSRDICYTETGDVSKLTCNGDTVSYMYGSANHVNGQYLGYMLSGGRNYSINNLYDGFGHICRVTTKDSSQKVLLDTVYTADCTGKVQSLTTTSTLRPDLNGERHLVYDGLGQIIRDTHSANGSSETKYTYDGNSNVISKTVDDVVTTMSYNPIDQRADKGFKYDTNGRMIKDDDENWYYYDDRDRLTMAIRPGEFSDFGYQADGYLSYHNPNGQAAQLYYSCSKINAIQAEGNTSLLLGGGSLVASYSDKNGSSYFLDTLGSTAVVMGDSDNVSLTYDAYGASKSSSKLDVSQRFGFQKELFDPKFSLVYLRTRFYSQKHMAFLTMDRYSLENRYTYCDGDPINNIDPLGLFSWKIWLAIGVGAVVAGVVTMGVGFAVEAALGAVGVGAVGAAMAAGAIGGAVGNVAGGAVMSSMLHQKYTLKQGLIDAGVGAVGGFAGAAVGPIAESATAAVRFGDKPLSKIVQESISAGIGSSVDQTTQATLRPVLQGQPIDPLKVAESATTAFLVGSIGGNINFRAKSKWEALSPRALAAVRQGIGRIRGRAGVYNVQKAEATFSAYSDMVDLPDLVNDLPVFTSGRYTGLDVNMAEASSILIRPCTVSLGASGARVSDNPVEIVRL